MLRYNWMGILTLTICKLDDEYHQNGRVLASQAQNHVPRKNQQFELPNILDFVTLYWLAYIRIPIRGDNTS